MESQGKPTCQTKLDLISSFDNRWTHWPTNGNI